MKKLLFIVILLFLCFVESDFAQEQTGSKDYLVKGVFKTVDSSVISNLRLYFKSGEREITAFTDTNGEFSVLLPPGFYKLTAGKIISEQFAAFLNIQENGLNPNFVEFIVEPNQNYCDSSSGSFFPKIIRFIKPIYPMAAKAVRATGEVVVIISIDSAGNVVSAKAVSGHPLLRAASEKLALSSAFEASENSETRDAQLFFVFLLDAQIKENIKRYAPPCRMEIISGPSIVNISETKN
jgi:hypothetical protein